MGVDFNGTILDTAAEAKTALDKAAANPDWANRLIESLSKIMGRNDLRYTVTKRHIEAMLAAARAESAAKRHQAVMATLPYPKFWGVLSDDDIRTSATRLVVNDDVKTLAGIAQDFAGDTHFNRVIAPFVTQMGRRIKAMTNEKDRNEQYSQLSRAVKDGDILRDALVRADQPERPGGSAIGTMGPNRSATRLGTRQP